MKKLAGIIFLVFCTYRLTAQELFVFTEPASNMPAKSIAVKVTGRSPVSRNGTHFRQRYTPEVMYGVNKQLMVHIATTFSDFYTPALAWESWKLYGKWRFFSQDDVHRHFRLAAFAEGSYSKSRFYYGDINLDGDNSGIQGGIIATQLLNKLALSATSSIIKVLGKKSEHTGHDDHAREALNYTFSAGYLLFPLSYTDYKQANLNVYMEMIGMRGLDKKHSMLDLAPSLQLILNSNFKINAGYRFQVKGDMLRIGEKSWVLGVERTFL